MFAAAFFLFFISNKNELLQNESAISAHFCGKTAIFKNENSIVRFFHSTRIGELKGRLRRPFPLLSSAQGL